MVQAPAVRHVTWQPVWEVTEMLFALAAILAFLLVFFLVVKVVAVLTGFVFLLLVAFVAGAIAEKLLDYKQGGIGTTLGVGFLGAVVGWLIAKVLHLPGGPAIEHLPVLWTIVGAVVLTGTMKVVAPTRRRLPGQPRRHLL